MAAITPETLHAVAARLGLEVDRFEETRPGDAESIGNGNWFAWHGDHRHVLRRYHVLHTAEDLAYESAVLRHLTARGWSVPTPVTGPIRYDERLWAATRCRVRDGRGEEDRCREQPSRTARILRPSDDRTPAWPDRYAETLGSAHACPR